MGEGSLDNPVLSAESAAVFGAASRDPWLDSERADEAAVLVVIVTAVTEHDVGAAPGSAALAPHGRHSPMQWWDELGDVVAIATGQGDGGWNARDIGNQMVLAARPAPVDRTPSRLGPPLAPGCGSRRPQPARHS